MSAQSRAWVFGDNIDTDAIAPAIYLKGSIEDVVPHCMESIDPDFAGAVREGDVFVAGANLGIGSSREQAPQALQHLGIRAVLAKSFGRIFYRNALNLGMPALICADVDRIRSGDSLRVDAEAGKVENLTTGETLDCDPLPPHLMEMVRDGGLLPHLKKQLAKPKR
ncbi:MAG: 3-isopropylmalate dehydratase [Gammaproteobacteria bacterium]|nr:3-isopropylmalate dehydratase [Gammaproteobacteria bacterium]